jgi:hypothetical protein
MNSGVAARIFRFLLLEDEPILGEIASWYFAEKLSPGPELQ